MCLAAEVLCAATVVYAVDSDQDGVDDSIDVCCNTPADLTVDGEGRPIGDLDGDCDVDLDDMALLETAISSAQADLSDYASFQLNFTDPLEPSGACCAVPLNPVNDGTGRPIGGIPNIIISEINPNNFIEVFNSTNNATNLSAVAYQWCSPFQYRAVAVAIVVPAGGYAELPWPTITNAPDSGGQIILYTDSIGIFSDATKMLDFVCWGTGTGGRKFMAEDVNIGKWSGDCVAAIPAGGSLSRKPNTTGTSAAS